MKLIKMNFFKASILLFFILFFMNSMKMTSYAIAGFAYTLEYEDEENDTVIKTEEGISYLLTSGGYQPIDLQPSFTEGGKTFLLSSEQPKLLDKGILDFSVPQLTPDPSYIGFVLASTSDGRALFEVQYHEKKFGYEIHYVDENGNRLIPDEGGRVPDMTWVSLNMEFTATLYDAGKVYRVKREQSYPSDRYRYNSKNDAGVLIGEGQLEYTIVCEKKPESSGSSSGGGGSSSSVKRVNTTDTNQTVKQGWILENDIWYYYSGTTRSSLKKGWHLDPQDGRWYYLDLTSGAMLTGWNMIGGEWYYLNPYTPQWTWEMRSDGEWYFKNIENSKPLGSMYANEKTPDGYMVDSNGRYIH